MPIEIHCPNCKRKYAVIEEYIGRSVVCANVTCESRFIATVEKMQDDEAVAAEFFEVTNDPVSFNPIEPVKLFQPTRPSTGSADDQADHESASSEENEGFHAALDTPHVSGAHPVTADPMNVKETTLETPQVSDTPQSPLQEAVDLEFKTDLELDATKRSKNQFWGMAKKVLGDASTHVSNAGVAVSSKAASFGSSGVAKATEVGKQTFIAANAAIDASGAKETIKATASVVSGKLDEVSGKRLVELLEKKLAIQDSYNDILATRLAEALDRIKALEDRVDRFITESLTAKTSASEIQR
jgi:hypothetical protein